MKKLNAAALLLACAAQGALADAQSTVTIGQASVVVTDLTPGDGVTAGVSWGSNWTISGSFSPSVQTSWNSVLAGWGGVEYSAGWAAEPVTSFNTNSTASSFSTSVLGGLGVASAQFGVDGSLSQLNLATSAPSGQRLIGNVYLSQSLKLSPGTSVTVSMPLTGRVAVEAAAALTPPQDVGYSYPPHGYAKISADQFASGTGSSFSSYVANYMFANMTGARATDVAGVMLVATISNASSGDSYYSFALTLNTEATQINTAIPEPSTYALMALGLLGVGAAARRRRA